MLKRVTEVLLPVRRFLYVRIERDIADTRSTKRM